MTNAAAPAGPWLTTRLFIRLRVIRLVNGLSGRLRQPMGSKRKARVATQGKRRNTWIITMFVFAIMMFNAFNLSNKALHTMQVRLAPDFSHLALDSNLKSGVAQLDTANRENFARASANEWSLLIVASLLLALANRDIVAGDSELEWLSSLPVTNETLMFGRICERSVLNISTFLLIWPATVCLYRLAHLDMFASLVLSLVAAMPVMIFCAALRTLFETGMRMVVGPAAMRNLQALLGVTSVVILYLAITPAMPAGASMIHYLSQLVVPFARFFPGSLMTGAPGQLNIGYLIERLGLLWLEALFILAACLFFINALLRRGLVVSGNRESGRRAVFAKPESNKGTGRRISTWWTELVPPLQRRELRLLLRDRNFMIRTLALPAIILIANRLMVSGVEGLNIFSQNSTLVASSAFGLAAYCMILSALQTLITEGRALWLAYTFPVDLEDFLKEKARLWAVLTMIYPIAIYGYALSRGLQMDMHGIGMLAKVLLGVPIFSFIATALGVFACDPLSEEPTGKVRITYLYLFMLLAGVYIYAITISSQWQSLIMIALLGLFAQALWQKARDDLPYLLDPTALPPPKIATADGLMAALLFFVMQVLTFALLDSSEVGSEGSRLLISYSLAGAVTYGLARLSYWRAKTVDVPVMLRGMRWIHAGAAIGLGLGVAAFAIGYIAAMRHFGLMAPPDDQTIRQGLIWLFPLAVIAAPLFEEFIFRGLVFGGLRRSQTHWFAVLGSAALFAVLHPPQSMVPVFVFGVGAAILYDRSRALLATMIAHAVYNGSMVLFVLFGLPLLI